MTAAASAYNYRWPDYEVDVLVRGHGHLDLTRRLLDSLYRQSPGANFHVTYVDNGSEIMHLADLQAEFPTVTMVRLPFNHGSVRAINVGLQLAFLSKAPYVLLMDNDAYLPDGDVGWLSRWLAYFEDDKVGAAGAVSSYASLFQNAEAVPDHFNLPWSDGKHSGGPGPTVTPLLVSFAMLMRKRACRQIGLFDERFEPGNCEDFDYSLRLVEAGWKNVVAASVWVHHTGSQTFGEMGFQTLLNDAKLKLVEKWGEEHLRGLGIAITRRPA